MKDNYINGKGILIGCFTRKDCKNGIDKIETEKAKEKYNLKYVNTEIKNNKLLVYVCSVNDFKI